LPLGENRVKRNERGDMKCIHKNDGENKIETNFEVYCDEKLLIKSDSVYFVLGQTWCGILLLAGRLLSSRSPDHQTSPSDARCLGNRVDQTVRQRRAACNRTYRGI